MSDKISKLHAIAVREVRFIRPDQLSNNRAIAALSTLSRALPNADELQKQADLLHIEAVLVSEGINDNDDAFTHSELKRAVLTPILKPMNWQHKDSAIMGAMYAAEARDLQGNPIEIDELNSDEPFEIVVQGAIWYRLPHIQTTAEQIVQRIEDKNLFVSMECWFDNYDFGFYTESGELYDLVPRNNDTAFLDQHRQAVEALPVPHAPSPRVPTALPPAS